MAPKPNLRQKRNILNKQQRRNTPSSIPIYQILIQEINQQQSQLLPDLFKKLKAIYEESDTAFNDSIMNLLMDICGLGELGQKVNWRQNVQQQVSQVLEVATDKHKKHKSKNKRKSEVQQSTPQFPLLFIKKSKFLSKLHHNIYALWRFLISYQTDAIFQTDIMNLIFGTLNEISKCRLRNIRASAIQACKMLIDRTGDFYLEISGESESPSKRAKKLFIIMHEGYIDQIIKHRIKDIDVSIQQKCFKIMEETVTKTAEHIEVGKLEKMFADLINETNKKTVELSLKILYKIFEVKKKKASKHMLDFSLKILPLVYETVFQSSDIAITALKCLVQIQHFSESPTLLNPKQILKLFQWSSRSSQSSQSINYCIQLFLYSISSYNKKSDLVSFKQTIVIEITNLLSSLIASLSLGTNYLNGAMKYVNAQNNKTLKEIMWSLFGLLNHKDSWVISFEDIFLLLFSEYYYSEKDEIDIEFRDIEIYVLLLLSTEFSLYIRKTATVSKKDSPLQELIQAEINKFNNSVLMNGREIFYDKIIKYHHFSFLYLKLFGLIQMPLNGSMNDQLDFIIERLLSILKEQKFIVMGQEDIQVMYIIVRECIYAFHNLTEGQNFRSSPLIISLKISDLFKGDVDPIEILKISAISTCYRIQDFYKIDLLKNCLSAFSDSGKQELHTKLQFLAYFSNAHQTLFQIFYDAPSQFALANYVTFRNSLLDLITVILFSDNDSNWLVKYAGFGLLCQILKLSGHDRIAERQFTSLYCELNERHLQKLTEYIKSVLTTQFNYSHQLCSQYGLTLYSSEHETEEFSLTSMMDNLNLECPQFKQKVIEELFSVWMCNQTLCIQSVLLIGQIIGAEYLLKQRNLDHQNITQQNITLGNQPRTNGLTVLYLKKNIDRLVNQLIKKEIQESNRNKFVFWRFYTELTKCLILHTSPHQQDEQNQEISSTTICEEILMSLIQVYLKYKKNHSGTSKTLNDKMMLHLADSLDKIISSLSQIKQQSRNKYFILSQIRLLDKLIRKIYRRYPKEVLHRFSIFFNSKLQSIQSSLDTLDVQSPEDIFKEELKKTKQFCEKISKVRKQKEKEEDSEEDDEDSSKSSEEEEEEKEKKMKRR